MPEFIDNLHIKGFRALSELRVEHFGKVNLITGKNNSGKSSLLEALRILATGGALRTIVNILDAREELVQSRNDEKADYVTNNFWPLRGLFHGFPDLLSQPSLLIQAAGVLPASIVPISMSIKPVSGTGFMYESDKVKFAAATEAEILSGEFRVALDISVASRNNILMLDRADFSDRSFLRHDVEPTANPCVYVDSFGARLTRQMGALWDAIALTETEQEIVNGLQMIAPDIQAISMIGDNRTKRIVIAKSRHHKFPVPLRTFGDGMNRLFGIILSLCNARNGILLIDEIENGLHFSVQTDIWRSIFRLAQNLNVQVFATSHSWDCVQAFQQAAQHSPENGVLVRLNKLTEDKITATTFSEQELAIVTRDHIEVR